MKGPGRWLVALVVLLLGRGRRHPRVPEPERALPEPERHPGAELLVLALLALAGGASLAFVLVYAFSADTQWLGLCLGGALAAFAVALAVADRRLVPREEAVEEREPLAHPAAQDEVAELVDEAGDGLTRKRVLLIAGGGAGTLLAAALVTPVASLGPALGDRLISSPWRRGRLLVDERGRPLRPDDVPREAFVTAFAIDASRYTLGSPLILVRLPEEQLDLPPERRGWTPGGVLAFSKICTHAGCAISLYRFPSYEPTSLRPALVCPCHYSTFDVRRGGEVIFGPAARGLPQLPLALDARGRLVAAGDFSGPVGPSWSGL